MPISQKIALLLCLLSVGLPALAQTDELNIRSYGFEDGLSHRNTFKVQQDTNGFIWVATAQGLNRFDGHGFLAWQPGDERYHLPNAHVTDLLLGEGNRLLLAFAEGGTAIFDLDKNQVDTMPGMAVGGGGGQTGSLCQDATGRTWAVTSFKKDSSTWLVRSGKGGNLAKLAKLPGSYPHRPVAKVGGLVFVGAYENEIWAFDLSGKQVSQFDLPHPAGDRSFSRAIKLQATPDGTLWALLDHGQVYSLLPGAGAFAPHPVSRHLPIEFRSSAFCVGPNGDIWLGGIVAAAAGQQGSPCSSIQPGPSLFHHSGTTGITDDHSFYLKKVLPYAEPPRQIFLDRTGTVWMATAFGLVKLVDHDLFTRYMSDGNDCCRDGVCSMRGIAEDGAGNLYFAYYNSIHELNPRTGSLTPLFSKQIGAPFGIVGHGNALWTGEGLRINLATLRVDTVVAGMAGAEGVAMLGPGGKIWFANQRKLVAYDPKTRLAAAFQDEKNVLQNVDFQNFTWLQPSRDSSVFWAATKENGFFKIKPGEGVLRHFNTQTQPKLPHDRILSLCETGGHLWAGTAAGLARLDLATDRLKVFTEKDGLPNSFINGLLAEGDSAIWASTDNGLARLDLHTGIFTSFFTTDGLSKNEFNRSSAYRASDGRLYFGGINGVNAFYPSARYSLKQDKQGSRLLLTEFSRYDGEHDHLRSWGFKRGECFELSHHDEMFAFRFTLADFSDPNIHLYSYKLEGYDKDWSKPSPANFARYFNIPAGKYRLRVRASRGLSDWVADELEVPVVISEAFYKTGVFQSLVLGLITALLYGIMRYRLHLLHEHEKELETLVQHRTRELEAEKSKSEDLLLNILPAETAEELKTYGKTRARRYDNATVMFSDFVGFSLIASNMEPEELVSEIDLCFRAFDEITELYGLEKIKTVGDAYLLAGGISNENEVDVAVRVVKAAMEIQSFLEAVAVERAEQGRPSFRARVGIHSGPVVAGIVGIKKFAYDIWGDTVNISARMQSSGEVGKVNISKTTFELVKSQFECTRRGMIEVKSIGEVEMYFVGRMKQ